MPVATMRELLESGIHFGHQTRRWNPKMRKYIFGQRNGIYIIDLQKTVRQLRKAYQVVRDTVSNGGIILFVGTKKQAQEPIAREAERCGMYYINSRWLGGTLTNFQTVQRSVARLLDLEERDANGKLDLLSKKEAARLRKEKARLDKNLRGIKEMRRLPNLVFIIDTKKEAIAVREAERLGIPCIGIVDTNADPDAVPYPIAGNDDAIRAVNLFCRVIADAALEGAAQGEKADVGDSRSVTRMKQDPRRTRDAEAAPQADAAPEAPVEAGVVAEVLAAGVEAAVDDAEEELEDMGISEDDDQDEDLDETLIR
ncbi:MAG TPA: 30S ribosomal protein S2 [Candidatus Hydrogenedentes bacterium]|nr:30S ribosomal protein S2 [Candidatus Hydrogenedentota bacterium]